MFLLYFQYVWQCRTMLLIIDICVDFLNAVSGQSQLFKLEYINCSNVTVM